MTDQQATDPRELERVEGYTPYTPGEQRTVSEQRSSYWERPENVAGAYQDILAAPDNDWASFGIDRDFVTEAHDYMGAVNQGKSWWDWKPLDMADPYNERLRSMSEPAPDYQHSQVYKPDYLQETTTQPQTPMPGGADLENLTGWQRTMAFLQSNGTLQGITNMLPWMAIGGVTGFAAGGPVGGILGAGGAMIAGGLMGWAGDPETQEAARTKMLAAGYDPKTVDFLFNVGNSALRYLNLPAEKLEQAIGTTAQLGEAYLPSVPYRLFGYQSMYDEYVKSQSDVQSLMDNLPAVWEASRLTYESVASMGGAAGGITHLPAGIEWLLDTALHGSSDVDFAGIGEVYTLTSPDPVKLDVFGAALLAAARNEVKSGADPMKVIEKYQAMTGFSGQFADLMYQSFADPLNIMPIAERGVVKVGAKLTHNPVLELASGMAKGEGAIGTFRSYGELLRQGVEGTPLPQNMTRFQRYVADLTPEGVRRELVPGATGATTRVKRGLLNFAESPLNPHNLWRSIAELTPKSKYAMFTGMAQGNLGEIIRFYDGDVAETVKAIDATIDKTPAELRVMGSHLGNPEMYTIRQGLSGYRDKLRERYSKYQLAEPTRQLLLRVSEVTGQQYKDVVKALVDTDPRAANNLYQQTVNKIRETAPDSPLLRDPAFNPNSLKQAAALFKSNPWVSDPGFFQAALYHDITNHLERWAVEAYGVKPEAALFRANAAMKAAQSLVLLDFNPAYLVNNVVNNAVTMAAEGVGGFVGPTDITRYLNWIGRDLGAKASEGIGMAGEGGKPIKQQYTSFEQAYQEGGWDAAIAWASADAANIGVDATKVDGAISKLKSKIFAGPMRAMSGKMESTQSVIAHYNATMQAWAGTWHRNGTIPKMPAELSADLARIDPRMPELITAGIEGAKTKAELNAILSGAENLRRRADPYVEGVINKLKIDSPMTREMLAQTNVIEKINGYLDQGASVEDAFQSVAREIDQLSKENLRERQQVAAAKGGALFKGEGIAGGVNAMRDMAWGRDEFWGRMFRENESAYTLARDMLGPDRRKFMDEHFRLQNEEWRTQKAHEEAQMYGFLREAGFTDPAARDALSVNAKKFMGDMVGMNSRWDKFYQLRERRVKKFFKDSGNSSPEDSARLWSETQKELGIAYDQYSQMELDSVKRMGQTFLEMYQEQYGGKGIEGVAYWWKGMYDTAQRRINLMADMRAWERGDGLEAIRDPLLKSVLSEFSPDDRHAAWPKFLEKVYMPAIGEMTQAHLDGVKAFSDAATGRALPPEMAEALRFFDREPDADPVADVQATVQAVEETTTIRAPGEEPAPIREEPEPTTPIEPTAPIESGQPVPIEQATDTTATPRTLDDIYAPSLKQEGWTRGKKGLLNAVNADRAEAVRQWAGNTQVTNNAGDPKTVYHGTYAQDFTTFEPGRRGAIWFAESPEHAAANAGMYYSGDEQTFMSGARTIPAYLRLENPARYEFSDITKPEIEDRIIAKAKEAGNDGVIFKDNQGREFYVVFSNDQIQGQFMPLKSAKDVPFDEAMAAMRKRVPAQEKPPEPADLPAAKEPRPAVTVQRYLEPHVLGDKTIIGAAYVNGKFAAYIPYRFETNKVFTTAEGPARLLGVNPDGQWVYRLESGEVKTLVDGDENIPVTGAYLPGTLESHGAMEPDQAKLYQEGWGMHMRPILDEMARQMKQGGAIGGDLANLDEAAIGRLRQYIEQVGIEMSTTKRAAVRFGDMKRDFALLDYNKRYGFDDKFGLVFPYQFWFTRSMVNWALRFADRPGMLAFFARLSQFTNEEMDEKYKIIPSRLKNKVRIPVPFLESFAPWTGGNLYVDPWGKLFPFREFLRPWEQYLTDQNRVRRKAEQYLRAWADEGQLSGDEAAQAAETMSGAWWDKAMAEANLNEGGDIVDFMSVMSSPSLAISMLVRGPEKTGPFPLSRFLQGLSAATGMDSIAGLDIEAQLRKGAKLSEFGEWGDYYVDRQLANLAADGIITADDATIAMIERTGPAFEMAMDRVRMETAMRQPGMLPLMAARNALQGDGNILDILGSALVAWLPGGLLPEGELKLRGLQSEYSQAWQDFHAGDKQALDNFFEAHPEYKARLSLFDEPEERLQNFMVSAIWDKYGNLPEPYQKEVADRLGPDFREYFLNSETRDYSAIPPDMLAQWSQMMGGYAPEGTTYTEPLQFQAPDAAQEYQQLKDQMFPGIGAILSQYYNASQEQKALIKQQYPQIQAYQNWRDTYIAHNPALIPYMVSEDSELAQADPETAYMVYMYRAEKARLFPQISELLDQYYTLEGTARKTFGKQNPAIYAYWDWDKQMMAQSPQIARYVKSDASAFKTLFGNDYVKEYGTPVNVYQWPNEMQTQMQAYFGQGRPLGPGAKDYAYLQWERSGRPFGSFTTWLKSLGVFYGAVQ